MVFCRARPVLHVLGIPAHISGQHFIGHNTTLGIDDKSAALRHAVRFDQHIEIADQRAGGVS